MLFNTYLSDIPSTTSHQYGYADDHALFHSDKTCNAVENTLTKDTLKISDYLLKWRLKLNTTKTTTTAFHLNSRDSNCKLMIDLNGITLPHNKNPSYLEIKLDRQLTFRPHPNAFCRKVEARNNLLRCLASTSWGANATTLRTAALVIVYSAAEYAAPTWCRSTRTKRWILLLTTPRGLLQAACAAPQHYYCLH